jgi:hypothetical protein
MPTPQFRTPSQSNNLIKNRIPILTALTLRHHQPLPPKISQVVPLITLAFRAAKSLGKDRHQRICGPRVPKFCLRAVSRIRLASPTQPPLTRALNNSSKLSSMWSSPSPQQPNKKIIVAATRTSYVLCSPCWRSWTRVGWNWLKETSIES